MAVAIPAVSSYGASSPEPATMATEASTAANYQPVVIINIKPVDILPII